MLNTCGMQCVAICTSIDFAKKPKSCQGFFLQFWEGALGPFRLGKLAR